MEPAAKGDEELGRRLRRLRTERGRSTAEVVDACTLPLSALGAYERGQQAVPATRLARLCTFYGVTVDDVLGAAPARRSVAGIALDTVRVPFDLQGLERVRNKKAKTAAEVVGAIRQRRSTVRPSDGVFVIRRDDLFTIGAMVGMSVDALVELLRAEGALRNPTGRPPKVRAGVRR
ncbi:MAG: helix-turn-helix domain-containing protein [Acidimicrobiales bacterium]